MLVYIRNIYLSYAKSSFKNTMYGCSYMKMGCFVRDLHKQIAQLHDDTDSEKLKDIHDDLISTNDFLSTSADESVSHICADSSGNDSNQTRISLDMEIDPMISPASFASSDAISCLGNAEQEILFFM